MARFHGRWLDFTKSGSVRRLRGRGEIDNPLTPDSSHRRTLSKSSVEAGISSGASGLALGGAGGGISKKGSFAAVSTVGRRATAQSAVTPSRTKNVKKLNEKRWPVVARKA